MERTPTVTVSMDGNTSVMSVKPKEFKTGSRGFYVWGKVVAPDGKRYQVGMNLVEIGSKNRTD